VSRSAIIVVPFSIEVDSSEEAEELCEEIDRTVHLNVESTLEQLGVEGKNKEAIRPLNATVIGYINWRDE